MKISKGTLDILRNFATINESIYVRDKNLLRTIAQEGNILAEAAIDEVFPKPFAIYKLDEFLACIGLFSDPNFDFGDDSVVISEGPTKVLYRYAAPTTIRYEERRISEKLKYELEVPLQKDTFQKITKGASALGADRMIVSHNGDGKVVVSVVDSSQKNNSNRYAIEVADTDLEPFNFVFDIGNLKVIPDDYTLRVSAKNVALFVSANPDRDLKYFMTLDESSKYGA